MTTDTKTDTELIEQARKGDKQAFTQLVRTHQNILRGFIAVRINTAHDVDDLAQEAFILAFGKLDDLQNPESFRPWLCGIAHNLVRNYWRKFNPTLEGNESELELLITDELEHQFDAEEETYPIKTLNECLQKLNQELKTLFEMHYLKGHSIKSLTEKYGLKHSTLTMRFHRTREQLRKCITTAIKGGLR